MSPELIAGVNSVLDYEYQKMKIALIGHLCQEVREDGYGSQLSETIRPYVDGKRV